MNDEETLEDLYSNIIELKERLPDREREPKFDVVEVNGIKVMYSEFAPKKTALVSKDVMNQVIDFVEKHGEGDWDE
ncbi:hypothetical protein [Endozoicomonas ascidiicola]|uniref:hypothetical protein n=1 Tax=Endozoicomonas ascidiicola TaxID=1698521 RepID=UPI000833E1C3|nr:hypothetical protein [Endozoicomonas ascidiicola]